MNSVFQKGLKIVQHHENAILTEWKNIILYLQQAGKKSAMNVENAVLFFTKYLFSSLKEFDHKNNDKVTYLPFHEQHQTFETNKFIITLLENAVHKVLQENGEKNYDSHQAVHYLFSKLSESLIAQPYEHYFSVDYFLRNLVTSKQLPILWAAIVTKKGNNYVVEKWFNDANQDLLIDNDLLKASTIYSLSELLLQQMVESRQKQYTVLPIPYEDTTFFICVPIEESMRITPFITYALQIFENGRNLIVKTTDAYSWKDSVIMFNEAILQSKNYQEAVQNITSGFVNYLPFQRCALFSYSPHDEKGFGLFGYHIDTRVIQSISEDVNNLPIIQNNLNVLRMFKKSINYLQPLYIEDASQTFPKRYIEQFQLRSIVVTPIYTSSNNRLIGAALLDQGPGKYFKVCQETFSALLKCGKSAGEILATFLKESNEHTNEKTFHLSPREIEVLKLMAEGASTSEAAFELNLSEYTVRDYISTIMQKMEAKNRTEAVARAIRKGII